MAATAKVPDALATAYDTALASGRRSLALIAHVQLGQLKQRPRAGASAAKTRKAAKRIDPPKMIVDGVHGEETVADPYERIADLERNVADAKEDIANLRKTVGVRDSRLQDSPFEPLVLLRP